METTQALVNVSRAWPSCAITTYKNPRQNTATSCIFRLLGMSRCLTGQIGIAKMAKSVTMLMIELMLKTLCHTGQCVLEVCDV